MGAYKQMLEELNEQDDGLNEYLCALVESKELDAVQTGVMRATMGKGVDNLTSKQRYIFDQVIQERKTDECIVCGDQITWFEMWVAEADAMCDECRQAEAYWDAL